MLVHIPLCTSGRITSVKQVPEIYAIARSFINKTNTRLNTVYITNLTFQRHPDQAVSHSNVWVPNSRVFQSSTFVCFATNTSASRSRYTYFQNGRSSFVDVREVPRVNKGLLFNQLAADRKSSLDRMNMIGSTNVERLLRCCSPRVSVLLSRIDRRTALSHLPDPPPTPKKNQNTKKYALIRSKFNTSRCYSRNFCLLSSLSILVGPCARG